MGWNPEKWVRFTSPYLDQPKPIDISKKYSEAVKEDEVNHKEDIDLDALGVQRVKEYLSDLAAITPGSQGPRGDPGIPTANTLTWLTSDSLTFTGPAAHYLTPYNFAPGVLDGTKDLIKITLSFYNVSAIKVEWTPTAGPPSKNLFASGSPMGDGYVDIWAAEVSDQIAPQRCHSTSVGTIIYTSSYVVANGWMAAGGDMAIGVIAVDTLKPCGFVATIYKLAFPQVTVE